MKIISKLMFLALLPVMPLSGQFESDVIKTSGGDLEMFFIGHGTLMFKFQDLVIHIDPVSSEADYATLPDADLVLVTHQHGDHLDISAIRQIMKTGTELIMPRACSDQLENVQTTILNNSDKITFRGIGIEALPAYNIEHTRPDGQPYHPRGEGNAYILTFGKDRVLIGGDTENIPELKQEKNIKVAFLPMNLPYTMTPMMVADLTKAIRPAILYPYHFGNTDTGELLKLLKEEKDIEVRIRAME